MAISISDEARLDERVAVASSGVVEVVFAIYRSALLRKRHKDSRTSAMILAADDLQQRLQDFWSDAPGDFTEALVLANRSGTLLDEDPSTFLAQVERTASESFEIPAFPSEDAAAAETIARHLLELRASPSKRQAYAGLLAEVWQVIAPAVKPARADSHRTAARLRAELADASSISDVLPARLLQWCDLSAPLVSPAVERGELVLVPLTLADGGRLFFALPGLLLLAFSPDKAHRPDVVDRSAAEKVATRYKVLADPTRLQLLGSLLRDETTISELATLYGLSQPTVSVHVKQLREAGLLESDRQGSQTLYRANPDRVRDLLGDDTSLLIGS